MAANKFATMLHRNTNKITLILIYAILEWILIVLLLLNSLFSYLIIKFADYFGLKRPCLWCSRLDHVFDTTKSETSYRDLLCDAHAAEISKLGFCSSHRKLAESQDMCEDCSSSSQPELCKNFAFFPWMKQIGMIQDDKVSEKAEVDSKCSCCGVSLEKKFYSPYLLIKPSWEILDYTQKDNLIKEAEVDDKVDEGDPSDQIRSASVRDHEEDYQKIEENRAIQIVSDFDGSLGAMEEEAEEEFSCFISSFDCKEMVDSEDGKLDFVIEEEQEANKEDDVNLSMDSQSCDQAMTQVDCSKEKAPEVAQNHLEFYIDQDDCHLIPVELMDNISLKNRRQYNFREEAHQISGNGDVILDFNVNVDTEIDLVMENRRSSEEKVAVLSEYDSKKEQESEVVDSKETFMAENENSSVAHEEEADLTEPAGEPVAVTRATQTSSNEEDDVQEEDACGGEDTDTDVSQVQAADDMLQMQNDETDAEISIGTEIPDQEPIDDIPAEELLPQYQAMEGSPSTSSAHLPQDDDHGSKQAEEILEFRTMTSESSEHAINTDIQMSADFHEIEEDKAPDTPSSIDSLHQLHKRLLLLERKESGTEDSLDGSVLSDIEGADGVLTVEKLKSALRTERKALNALYSELEEERSASAVAANQTMAMINRLQEEKAAMQMEALQYQRMMEEQSEYDQEALQLLNELMVKREKEKAELEKELELYRKKVQEYEAKEKMLMLRRKIDGSPRSRISTASCSNAEDSDGLSVDLNQEPKEEDSLYNHQDSTENQNTPADAVLYLEESLANFEEERLSILEQLKVLEEKLFTLNDEEEQHFEDIKSIEHYHEENANGHIEDFEYRFEANGAANGHSEEINGKHHPERKITIPKAKRLLPLFDAIDAETEDGVLYGDHENGFDSVAPHNSPVAKFAMETKKHAIEEEVDHVYERLQALEADREFLKHCISSLGKGDKGLYLLQEILQHLRDLRSVELRVRTMGDGPL